MTRRDMVFQGVVALALIAGIVVGNFVLHRWMLGNATSREADAGTRNTVHSASSVTEDDAELFDLKLGRRGASAAAHVDPTARREQLKKLIASKLPDASPEDQAAWLDKLEDVPLETAEGILDLRGELGSFDTQLGTERPLQTETPPISIPNHQRNAEQPR